MSVLAPRPLADLPLQAQACWLPGPDVDAELVIILDVIARQPLAAGVLLGRTTPVGEA